jgi:hypothetical protein
MSLPVCSSFPFMGAHVIDVSDEDILFERRTSTKRFLLFTATDVQPENPIGFWGCQVDVTGDAVGILVRLDQTSAPNGWEAYELLLVVLEMARAEARRRPDVIAIEVATHVKAAAAAARKRFAAADKRIEFDDSDGGLYALGTEPGNGDLWLNPAPEDEFSEGISAEAILIILDEMMKEATRRLPPNALIGEIKRHVRLALAAEVKRVTALRAAKCPTVSEG